MYSGCDYPYKSYLCAFWHCHPYSILQFCIIFVTGLDEEGLYRKPGIISKAKKLYKDAIEKGKLDSIDLTNEEDWGTKTIASAVKGYFGIQLEEPLMTFALYNQFINCGSKSTIFM